MSLIIRQAMPQDVGALAEILQEAARWLEDRGMAMWQMDELCPSRIAEEVNSGLFFLAERDGEAAGTIGFQLEDKLFWRIQNKKIRLSFIVSLSEDVSPAVMFLLRSYFGLLPARTHSAGVISAWIAKPRACAYGRFTSASDFGFIVTGKLALTSWRATSTTSTRCPLRNGTCNDGGYFRDFNLLNSAILS